MGSFSLLSTLTLGAPEFALCLYFSFLLILESKHLPFKDDVADRKKNIFKIILTVLIMSFSNSAISTLISDMGTASTLFILFSIPLLKFIYKITWRKAALASVSYALFLFSVEVMYIPTCISIFYKNLQSFYNDQLWRLILISLPIRIAQLISIITLWNWNLVLGDIKKYKINKALFVLVVLMIIWFEASFAQRFLTSFNGYNSVNRIRGIIECIACGAMNYVIFLWYIKSLKAVAKYYSL
ncbi:MAG: hypothetical protein Q8903_08665 [Bacteroidota bacterium]|nr:hypothetical protein [Bacteroidota bacterium]